MKAKHKKKYLVTGGTGFIGAGLVRQLVAEGHHVRVLDDFSRGAHRRLADISSKFEVIKGDVRNAGHVQKAAKGMDSICHLAFVNGTEFFYTKPDLVLEVGVKGMVNVLDACESAKVPELIVASSSEVYQTPPVIPTDESAPLSIPDPLNPRYSYAAGKIISEIMTINYGRKRIGRVVVFRPHNVFGPDMGWEHVIPEFVLRIKSAAMSKPGSKVIDFPILGTGRETRAFIYIDDFIQGLRLVMEKGDHMGIYHIGTSEEIAIRDAAKKVADCLGLSVRIVSKGAAPKGGTARRCPNINKLKKLGFKPKFTFEKGLKSTVEWYNDNFDLAPTKK